MAVDVYRNLHRAAWSLRERGKVVGHATEVILQDVRFVVQPAGLARVRATRQRMVHAVARGTLTSRVPRYDRWVRVAYDPYREGAFVRRDTRAVITTAPAVWFQADGSCWVPQEEFVK